MNELYIIKIIIVTVEDNIEVETRRSRYFTNKSILRMNEDEIKLLSECKLSWTLSQFVKKGFCDIWEDTRARTREDCYDGKFDTVLAQKETYLRLILF